MITFLVNFNGGPLKQTDVPLLVPTNVSLSGSGTTEIKATTYNEVGEGLEVCRGVVDVCKAASTGGGLGQFNCGSPSSVAVDKAGALYAVNQTPHFAIGPGAVYKLTFPAAGEAEAAEFAPGVLTQRSGTPGAVDPTDVAVDPANEHVLVAKKEGTSAYKFLEFDTAGGLLDKSPTGEATLKSTVDPVSHGLAIGNERFYFTNALGEVDLFGPPPPGPSVEDMEVEKVGTTTATFKGTVTLVEGLEGGHFETSYRFEYSRNSISWKPFPASEVAIGDGSGAGDPKACPVGNAPVCEVSQEVTGLEPNADYLARLVASNGKEAISTTVAFTTKAAPPSVTGMLATGIGQTTAKLTGLVNPDNQPSTYHFEWGETTAYGNETPGFEAFVGSGGEATKVSAVLSGLKEGAAYHFRIVANNATGETKGPDREFSTLNGFELPEGRAPEQVSANDKRPVGMVAQLGTRTTSLNQVGFRAAEDGESVIYPLLNGSADATAGGELEYLGGRAGTGWEQTQLTPPALVPAPAGGFFSDTTGRVAYASEDLSCVLIDSFEPLSEMTPELEEDLEKGVTNLYRRNPDGSHTLLSPAVPSNSPSNKTFHVDWASKDCKEVLFESEYKLAAGAPASGRGLYEWEEGVGLRLAGVRPDASIAAGAQAGGGSEQTNWNSMSEDGSKAFFTAASNEGGDSGRTAVFVRKGGSETVDASQSQTATPNNGASRYESAAADGSRVFFTARYGLAGNGTSSGASSCEAGGQGCDLYSYNTNTATLTDLSVDTNPADAKGASVVGLLDASDDGTYAYFAARGQLVANKGNTENQNLLGNGTYNVYLNHNGALAYVGLIGGGDILNVTTGGGSDLVAGMSQWVADATPDGGHLLFVSKADVTGYPSNGVANNGVTEAYLYTAAGETVCISCRADGLPSGETKRPNRSKRWRQEAIAGLVKVQNRPRSISDDGKRVFFTMPDVLAAGAVAGTHNIYEWSQGQVYLLEAGEGGGIRDFTEYVDSSASGNDVFVVTKAKRAARDFDLTTDLYDLRAGGGFVEPPPPPPACDPLKHECRPPPKPQPTEAPSPASEGFAARATRRPKRRKPHPVTKAKNTSTKAKAKSTKNSSSTRQGARDERPQETFPPLSLSVPCPGRDGRRGAGGGVGAHGGAGLGADRGGGADQPGAGQRRQDRDLCPERGRSAERGDDHGHRRIAGGPERSPPLQRRRQHLDLHQRPGAGAVHQRQSGRAGPGAACDPDPGQRRSGGGDAGEHGHGLRRRRRPHSHLQTAGDGQLDPGQTGGGGLHGGHL